MATKKDNTKEEVKDTKKEATTKKSTTKSSPKAKKRVVIDRDTEVIFMNNTNGNLFYKCPKTHFSYDMHEYGDKDYITVEQLLIMNNTSKKMLKELWVLLIETVDEDVELDDVLKYLGLDSLYEEEVSPDDIDGFILKSTDSKFKNTLKNMNKILVVKVVERASALSKEGKFNSLTKIKVLREMTEIEDLFE